MYKKLSVAFLLLSVILFILIGCAHIPETETSAPTVTNPYALNWQLHGTVISGGEIKDTLEFSIRGDLSSATADAGAQELTIALPDSFRYNFDDSAVFQRWDPAKFGEHFLVYGGYSYNNDQNRSVFSYVGISIDKEFVIFYWEDNENQYLVASTDPNADPMEIYDHFRETVNWDG